MWYGFYTNKKIDIKRCIYLRRQLLFNSRKQYEIQSNFSSLNNIIAFVGIFLSQISE